VETVVSTFYSQAIERDGHRFDQQRPRWKSRGVRDSLRAGANVNAKDGNGNTALLCASANDQNNKVDVNLQRQDGATVLYVASQLGRVEVDRKLLDHSKIDVNVRCKDGSAALDVAKYNKQYGVVNVFQQHQKAFEAADQDRKSLADAMTTRKDPVELTFYFIKRYITQHRELGSGAFGKVFLAEDSDLPEPVKFAVKLSPSSDEETLKTFKKELSVRSVFCI
jgi:hypothetical protein